MSKFTTSCLYLAAMLSLTAASPPQEEIVETYQLNKLYIQRVNGQSVFYFDAISEVNESDTARHFMSVSGDETSLQIGFETNQQGAFGGPLADIRPEFDHIKFNDPYNSPRADVAFTVTTDDTFTNRNIFVTQTPRGAQ